MKKKILLLLIFASFEQMFAQNYDFNAKGTFRMTGKDGTITSYFYLNTKNGLIGQDTQAWQAMTQETNGEIFSVIEYGKSMLQYVQMENKKYIIEMPLSKENYTATRFWQEFKQTGKHQTFGKYITQEYTNISKELSIWVSEKPYNIEGKLQGDVLGLYGVGYLYKPDEKVYYLLIHFKDITEGTEVTLLDMTTFPKRFNLSGYEKIKTPEISNITPQDNRNEDQETEPSQIPRNSGQGHNIENVKCSAIYQAAILGLEQSLPSYKELLNNPQIDTEQKSLVRKLVACLEKKLPFFRQAKEESLKAERIHSSNQEKLMEECKKVAEKFDKNTENLCPE